jgi:hypothetical protein
LRSREGIVGNPTPRGHHRLAQFLRPWTFHPILGALTAEGNVTPTPIAAATLDARGAVGSLAAEDLDYWFSE